MGRGKVRSGSNGGWAETWSRGNSPSGSSWMYSVKVVEEVGDVSGEDGGQNDATWVGLVSVGEDSLYDGMIFYVPTWFRVSMVCVDVDCRCWCWWVLI